MATRGTGGRTSVESVLAAVCAELEARYGAHTILLYGSRADGSAGPDSDLDIGAFAPIAQMVRDARIVDGVYVDAFVYPEAVLNEPQIEHLRFRGSRILRQRAGCADDFLERLDALHRAGPERLPADELAARRTWAHKMVARIRRGDAEGHYRRAWLLTALLEDYFHLRGRWFEGPKKALAWLRTNDPQAFHAIDEALQPGAAITSIERAVERVLDTGGGGKTDG